MKLISFIIIIIKAFIVISFTVEEVNDCMNYECNLLIEACNSNATCNEYY